MGTETYLMALYVWYEGKNLVKLNNPLMGTETSSQSSNDISKADGS